MKSERLKKLEIELEDLEQWLRLGLVPKKDLEKHKEEIGQIQSKIEEEKERLRFLKESGEGEEYIAPKKGSGKTPFSEAPTIPDMDLSDEDDLDQVEVTMETDTLSSDTSSGTSERDEDDEFYEKDEEEDDDDPFSDRNRWKRGILEADEDNW